VLFYHFLWLVESWVEEQIPSNLVLEAWIGLKQVVIVISWISLLLLVSLGLDLSLD
jgi:hypothetical protein